MLPEAQKGKRDVSRKVDHYNLGAIIAVGFRVNSARAVQFRQSAAPKTSARPSPAFRSICISLRKHYSTLYRGVRAATSAGVLPPSVFYRLNEQPVNFARRVV
ncbi:MAG: hypothetical protein CVV41_05945 [Candidatus Riflebacteria bacterium HGW-Riflebacteria-1]|nr:MAG: hypothetical protein CVV41_05945 [Candidatus Riflebacteria bacterium HGW-Riflebacteria-1]